MSASLRLRVKASSKQPKRRKNRQATPGAAEARETRHPGGQAAPREAGPQELFDLATREPASALPHRQALERRVGHSLSNVARLPGAGRSNRLTSDGRPGGGAGSQILLGEADPGLDVLLHEVVHVLQSEQSAPSTQGDIAAENSASERERGGNRKGRGRTGAGCIYSRGSVHTRRPASRPAPAHHRFAACYADRALPRPAPGMGGCARASLYGDGRREPRKRTDTPTADCTGSAGTGRTRAKQHRRLRREAPPPRRARRPRPGTRRICRNPGVGRSSGS